MSGTFEKINISTWSNTMAKSSFPGITSNTNPFIDMCYKRTHNCRILFIVLLTQVRGFRISKATLHCCIVLCYQPRYYNIVIYNNNIIYIIYYLYYYLYGELWCVGPDVKMISIDDSISISIRLMVWSRYSVFWSLAVSDSLFAVCSLQ